MMNRNAPESTLVQLRKTETVTSPHSCIIPGKEQNAVHHQVSTLRHLAERFLDKNEQLARLKPNTCCALLGTFLIQAFSISRKQFLPKRHATAENKLRDALSFDRVSLWLDFFFCVIVAA